MATAIEARVNLVVLNRGADLFFEGENVFVPFGSVAAKDLADTLATLGANRIAVQYRTGADAKEQARDRAKYGKRLAGLASDWACTEWANAVIRGYVQPQTMECILTRVN